MDIGSRLNKFASRWSPSSRDFEARSLRRTSAHQGRSVLPRPSGAIHRSPGRAREGRADLFGSRRDRTRRAWAGAAVLWVLFFPRPAPAGELVQNGSFETGVFGPSWVHGAYRGNNNSPDLADHIVVPDLPFTGYYSARFGFKYSRARRSAAGYMYQDVAIPTNISSARLYFKVRQQGYDTSPYDPFTAQVRRTDNTVLQTLLSLTFTDPSYVFKDGGWVTDDGTPPDGVDVAAYAGQTIRLYFEQANTNDNLWETWAYVDDVSLVYRKFVDLAVNGNGSDQFGAIGSGAGGVVDLTTLAADTVVFDLDVENEGSDTDSYRLTVNAPPGWTVRIDAGGGPVGLPYTTRVMAPGEVDRYRVLVVPPSGTPPGGYAALLDAVSLTHANRYDSVRMGVGVLTSAYGTDLAVEGNGYGVVGESGSGGYALKTGSWGSAVPYALELRNSGDAPSAFRVWTMPESGSVWRIFYGGTWYTTPFNTNVVAPGASAALTLESSVSAPQPGGDYETIVYARAAADTTKRDSVKAVLRLLAPCVDLVISGNGDGIFDRTFSGLGGSGLSVGVAGSQISFPITIQNEGGLDDSFDLSWVAPKPTWSAVVVIGGVEYAFPHRTPVVPAYSTLEVELKVSIPGNSKVGTENSILNAVSVASGSVSESVTAAIGVTDPGQVDLIIDGSGADVYGPSGSGLGGDSERTISPGDSTTFTVELRNPTGANAADISWNTPPGWRVTFDDRLSPVNAYPAGTYILKIVVPASSPGGTFDIIVDAAKTGRRFYVDSVRGRVNVTTRPIVDALVDGSGDGLYGALGTGLGGTSSQTRSAPATLNFTIELQNEGSSADAYTVSWNSVPWWQAIVRGSNSPYTTPPIPAGGFDLFTFEVSVPLGAFPGVYRYVLDIVSSADANVVESVEVRVVIVGPPRADLVIDGNGAGVFGSLGSGEGGYSLHSADPGTSYLASLEVWNAGSYADSFYVFWEIPLGWPSMSITVRDGAVDHTMPFWTPVIGAGLSSAFPVRVQVPAGAGPGLFAAIIDSHSSLAPQFPESVKLLSQTAAVVQGAVFDDRDHDGAFGPPDAGLGGVVVKEIANGLSASTDGGGRFTMLVAGGPAHTLVETNLSGFVSLSPDTVGPWTLAAGDTLDVQFADVPAVRLSSGAASNGIAGAFVDFIHRIDAGTRGPVTLSVSSDSSAVTVLFMDVNGDGAMDGGDRLLDPADLFMDPATGKVQVSVILRVFIPAPSPAGEMFTVRIGAVQAIDGTPLTSAAEAFDAVGVVDGAGGLITLHKSVDAASAVPGAVLTYTIEFSNSGLDSVQNIVILDPVSVFVDPEVDAFGPGRDVAWRKGGATVYLTLDSGDGDECSFTGNERLLRLVLSRNSPFVLAPGERGEVVYRAIVK